MTDTDIFEKEEVVAVEEFDRQLAYYNCVNSIDFFANNEFPEDLTEEQRAKLDKKLKKQKTFLAEIDQPVTDDEGDESNHEADKMTLQDSRPIDFINHKLSKLDSFFDTISAVKDEPGLLYTEPSFKIKEEMKRRKDIENKQINLFAGIYSLKSVFFNDKTKVPPPVSLKVEPEAGNIPKLVETFQFSGDLGDGIKLIPLPYEENILLIQHRVFNSIIILKKQPYYRKFLQLIYFSNLFQRLIIDTFWWCFLERYQKSEQAQEELFRRISKTYVAITYAEMDQRYRETFFKKIAEYLAMTVYTIFCTCFPDSFQTQFNDEFKEYICEICYLWMSGCKPIPRSFSKWNFRELYPASAVRAAEILQKTPKSKSDSVSNRSYSTPYTSNSYTNQSRTTMQSKQNVTRSSKYSSFKSRSIQTNYSMSDLKKSVQPRFKSCLPENSHVLGASHEIKSSLFNINGHSPLIDCFLYNHRSRKLNKADVLIQHPTVVDLPPLNAPTYKDVIIGSLKTLQKIEKELKVVQKKHDRGMIKMESDRIKYLQNYKRNQELLLSKPSQVEILGELLAMSKHKDPYTTSFGLEQAMEKALKKSGATSVKTTGNN